uniref:MYND-type domain-containing protein n=1 Tax=Caenorhabditis tropicalis TaxID=1561998 RepID=A0A1I7V3M5_9PELO
MENGNNDSLQPKIEQIEQVTDQAIENLYVDDKMRRLIIDLQRHWLTDYHTAREKILEDLTRKLHEEFRQDQEKIRADLQVQFKQELDSTRAELEDKHAKILEAESAKLSEKHKRELSAARKKQWCFNCDNEAIYHCCWNTSYCSVECQQGHWQSHRKVCRRKKTGGGSSRDAQLPQQQFPSSTQ